jgi:hypothetical protein
MNWLVLVFLVACSKPADDGPPCAAVMDHVLDLMKSTQGGHGGMNLGSRETMISTCEQRHMPKAVRSCMINSKDITGLANCSRMTPRPPPTAPTGSASAPVPPSPPAPAGSGTPAP